MEISLCMIVKNEESVLGNCLSSVCDLVDEIIIVDTGSTDATREIASRYTDKIFLFEWVDDFSAARNYSFSRASKDYCMWLDADDIITEENRTLFMDMKRTVGPEYDVVIMPYHYRTDANLKGKPAITLMRERIVRRSAGFSWENQIHEYLDIKGKAYICKAAVTHTRKHNSSDRNYALIERLAKKEGADLRIIYYYAGELCCRGFTDEAISQFEKFFGFGGGSSTYCYDACFMLHKLYLDKKQYDKALKISLEHIEACIGRSEFCCQIGFFYAKIMKDTSEAVYWFELAAKRPYPDALNSPVEEIYYYLIPYRELGRLYMVQERYEEALECLNKALAFDGNNREVHGLIEKVYTVLFCEGKKNIVNSMLKKI